MILIAEPAREIGVDICHKREPSRGTQENCSLGSTGHPDRFSLKGAGDQSIKDKMLE
jgi:hypothetical protein